MPCAWPFFCSLAGHRSARRIDTRDCPAGYIILVHNEIRRRWPVAAPIDAVGGTQRPFWSPLCRQQLGIAGGTADDPLANGFLQNVDQALPIDGFLHHCQGIMLHKAVMDILDVGR